MTESQAWLRQAASDLTAAQAVLKTSDATTYCQALAEYQQTVEKSAKAIIAAIKETGISFDAITRDHDPSRQIEVLVASRRALGQKLLERVRRIFPNKRINEIRQLCSLAPRYPRAGQTFARNTEYPFENGQGGWTAPASPGAFSREEVKAAHELAWLIKNKADRSAVIVSLRPRG